MIARFVFILALAATVDELGRDANLPGGLPIAALLAQELRVERQRRTIALDDDRGGLLVDLDA